jgi:TolB protein
MMRLLSIVLVCVGVAAAAPVAAKQRGIYGRIPNLITIEWGRVTVSTFVAETPGLNDEAREMTRVVRDVLERSGPYLLRQSDILDEVVVGIDAAPDFAYWRAHGTSFLVCARVSKEPDGRLKVGYRLWDVHSGGQIVGRYFTGADEKRQDLALAVAAEVFEYLTSEHDFTLSRLGIR